MADGKTHLLGWKIGNIFSLPANLYITFHNPVIGLSSIFGYMAGGFYIDPDLDLIGINAGEGRALKIPVIGVLLTAYSTIYGGFFKNNHRHFLSHFPIVSSAIRFLYFFWWIFALAYWQNLSPEYWWILRDFSIGTIIGLSQSDLIHWILDGFPLGPGKSLLKSKNSSKIKSRKTNTKKEKTNVGRNDFRKGKRRNHLHLWAMRKSIKY